MAFDSRRILRILWVFAAIFFASAPSDAQSPLDVNAQRFPHASQSDFSDLVPAPIPQNRGFLGQRDGHFVWENGERARFWGINVANASLQESDADIVAMLRNFRRAGFNLVRLHHFDERGGILDLERETSGEFEATRLKKLDFWIHKARENGLSVYLDLLGYRRFKAGDGVQNAGALERGAKPFALFDPTLIELQKRYAKKLLREHKNAFNGLAYADDPTVVMIEIAAENGLFIRRGVWRSMPAPYAAQFRKLWNSWLRETYGSTEAIRRAWGNEATGESELLATESLELENIEVPALTWETASLREDDARFAGIFRRSDGARFAGEIHRRYFREMREFLRGSQVGFRAQISSTGRYDDLAEFAAQGAELDFIACNFYYDHPYWASGKPQWQLPSFFHARSPLRDDGDTGIAGVLGVARVRGKPFVVREWNYCWPNAHRGEGVLEAATFAAFQDFDAMILFTYETAPTNKLGYFNVRSDPARWAMAAMGAQIFLRNLVSSAKNHIVVPYSETETHEYRKFQQPLYALGWTSQISNDFYETGAYTARGKTDLLVASGRAQNAQFAGAPSLIYGRNVGVSRAQSGAGQLDRAAQSVRFDFLAPREVTGAALDVLRLFRGVNGSSAEWARGVSRSDSGQIVRNASAGRLSVKTPQLQIFAGNLRGVGGEKTGISLQNMPDGALVALSLDGLPLVRSRRYVIKMTTNARNNDEKTRRDPRFAARPGGQWMLDVFGVGPVVPAAAPLGAGKSLEEPLQIALNGQPQLQLWGVPSHFELWVDGEKRHFFCDLKGAKFALHGGKQQTMG